MLCKDSDQPTPLHKRITNGTECTLSIVDEFTHFSVHIRHSQKILCKNHTPHNGLSCVYFASASLNPRNGLKKVVYTALVSVLHYFLLRKHSVTVFLSIQMSRLARAPDLHCGMGMQWDLNCRQLAKHTFKENSPSSLINICLKLYCLFMKHPLTNDCMITLIVTNYQAFTLH